MADLRLVGLSDDGRQVIVADEAGHQFTMPANDELRAALRPTPASTGKLETTMHSALRPRDIQARIRAGQSPEDVAALAQVDVDRVMTYAFPVLAERDYHAQLARRAHVRRKNVDGPAVGLGDCVHSAVKAHDGDPDLATWDAWKNDDGTWAVQVTYRDSTGEQRATFTYDTAGRFSVAADDQAKVLTGEKRPTRRPSQSRGTGRRLSAVQDQTDLLDLTEDDDELTAVVRAVESPESSSPSQPAVTPERTLSPQEPADEVTDTESADSDDEERDDPSSASAGLSIMSNREVTEEPQRRARRRRKARRQSDQPAGGSPATEADQADTPPATEHEHPTEEAAPEEAAPEQAEPAPVDSPAAAPTPAEPAQDDKPATKRRKPRRAAVPSWDEIMLGGSSSDDDA